MKHSTIARVLLSLLGLALILRGISNIALGMVGEPAGAVITSIRREGGKRDESIPGRYTYSIGYTFTLPDGRQIDGFTKEIGDAVFLKADGKSTMRIRYFASFPYISAPEEDTRLSFRQPVLMAAGTFLIVAVNQRRTIHPSCSK